MDFEEFCAAAVSVHQMEALDRWEQHARCAYELFDKEGNRAIKIEELASVSEGFISPEIFFLRFIILYFTWIISLMYQGFQGVEIILCRNH